MLSETVPAGTRSFSYTSGQLRRLTAGGATSRSWYEDRGNLDCVTTGAGSAADCLTTATGGTVSPRLLADHNYDYLDWLESYRSFTTDGVMATAKDRSDFGYDALDRPAEQITTRGAAPRDDALPLPRAHAAARPRRAEGRRRRAPGDPGRCRRAFPRPKGSVPD